MPAFVQRDFVRYGAATLAQRLHLALQRVRHRLHVIRRRLLAEYSEYAFRAVRGSTDSEHFFALFIDSVLGLVVTDTLYRAHPDLSEGRLAKLRAAVVNARALAEVARGIGLGEHIKLGRGEESTGGRDKASILSDTVEAVIGAIHLSGGIHEAAQVIHRLFDPVMEAAASMGAGLDWKTSLQELSANLGLGVPDYLIEDDGPDHMKTFVARVRVGEQVLGNGTGRSKKEAEQQAAETAYNELSAAAAGVETPPGADGAGRPATT